MTTHTSVTSEAVSGIDPVSLEESAEIARASRNGTYPETTCGAQQAAPKSLPSEDVGAACPARGKRDVLVVHGSLPPEAVAERQVQPSVQAAGNPFAFQEGPVIPDEVFRRPSAPRWHLDTGVITREAKNR